VLNQAPRHEDVLGSGGIATRILDSTLNTGEWSASRPGSFIPKESTPGTYWIGGWVGTRAGLDAVVKREIPSPHRESKSRTLIIQPVAQSLCRLSYNGGLIKIHCEAMKLLECFYAET
jgi:hypothetical protein